MFLKVFKLAKSVFACIVAAFVGTMPAAGAFDYFIGISAPEDKLSYAIEASWTTGWWMSLVTLLAMLLIGLPVQYGMQKADETGFWDHVLRATVAGFIVPCVFLIGILFAPFGAVAGFIAGSVFWLIRRPDKDPELPLMPSEDDRA